MAEKYTTCGTQRKNRWNISLFELCLNQLGALFHLEKLPCKAAELEKKWKLLVVQLVMNSVTVLWHHPYSTVQHSDLVSLSPEATWPQHGWVQHTWSVLFPSLSELISHCAIKSQHTSAQSWYNPLIKKWTSKDTVPDTAMYYGFIILWPSFSLCNMSKHLVTDERKRAYIKWKITVQAQSLVELQTYFGMHRGFIISTQIHLINRTETSPV